ncbi:MAG: hypothetical protein AAGA93_22830 [Actinomycetota bacterium]
MQQRYGDQVRFVGVPGLAEPESMARFVSDTGSGAFPHIPDGDGVIWERFGVTQQRTYIFINDDGTVRRASYGNLPGDVEDLIAS